MDFANPTFEQMDRHWFDPFCANPSIESVLPLALGFDFAGGRLGGLFGGSTLENGNQRSKVVLKPHPSDVKGEHHFWGRWTGVGDQGKSFGDFELSGFRQATWSLLIFTFSHVSRVSLCVLWPSACI
jgi:hypothetical protein